MQVSQGVLMIGPLSGCFQKTLFPSNRAYLEAVNFTVVHFIACTLCLLACFHTTGVVGEVGEELKPVLMVH